MIRRIGTVRLKIILVFIICLTFFPVKLPGQNMIGQSYSFIINYHQDRGVYQLPSETRNKDGKIHSLTYLHKNYIMELHYLFDENEICQAYSISCNSILLNYLIKDFNTRYTKLSENEWLSNDKNVNYKITLSKNPSTYSFYYASF
jgi:hypothetical protein